MTHGDGVAEITIGSNLAWAYCHMCHKNGLACVLIVPSRALTTTPDVRVASRHISLRIKLNLSSSKVTLFIEVIMTLITFEGSS